jgi:hypothetical protein
MHENTPTDIPETRILDDHPNALYQYVGMMTEKALSKKSSENSEKISSCEVSELKS